MMGAGGGPLGPFLFSPLPIFLMISPVSAELALGTETLTRTSPAGTLAAEYAPAASVIAVAGVPPSLLTNDTTAPGSGLASNVTLPVAVPVFGWLEQPPAPRTARAEARRKQRVMMGIGGWKGRSGNAEGAGSGRPKGAATARAVVRVGTLSWR